MLSEFLSLFTVQLQGENNFPRSSIQLLDDVTKQRLLNHMTKTEQSKAGTSTLKRLQELCPEIAKDFTVKENVLDKFRFRLFLKSQTPEATPIQSYIALSYRWMNYEISDSKDTYRYPLEESMFKAVVAQLNDAEGLWFDKCCIDQEDDEEKHNSISVMDTVYKRARAVVVVLWDVELDPPEVELLRKYAPEFNHSCSVNIQDSMKGYGFYPYLEATPPIHFITDPATNSLFKKLPMSEYFRRAFCGQEFRVARNVIFLLPCKAVNGTHAREFVRFTSEFMGRLTNLHPAVKRYFKMDSDPRDIWSRIDAVIMRKAMRNMAEDYQRKNPNLDLKTTSSDLGYLLNQKDSFVQNISDLFSMEAGGNPQISDLTLRSYDANKDRTIVTLNSVETFAHFPWFIRQFDVVERRPLHGEIDDGRISIK